MEKDYYAILGVEKTASNEEIRKAYKRLAKYYHPDINQSTNANYMFALIQEAYEHLMNQSAESSGIICGKCGKKNEPDSTFCFWCGNNLHQKQTTNRNSDPNLDKYVDLLLTAVQAENYSDCIKYSSWITEHSPHRYFGWIFRCVGLVGLYGISGLNKTEYDAYIDKASKLDHSNVKGLDYAINALLRVLSYRFGDEILPLYNNCHALYVMENQGLDDLQESCHSLISKTNDLIHILIDYFGIKYIFDAYKLMYPLAGLIRDNIAEKRWPQCKTAINRGELADTYEICAFTQWITQAPFIDPYTRLTLNYNAIQMLEYHRNHIPRRDTKIIRLNTQYSDSLKSYRKKLEDEQQAMSKYKKEHGL